MLTDNTIYSICERGRTGSIVYQAFKQDLYIGFFRNTSQYKGSECPTVAIATKTEAKFEMNSDYSDCTAKREAQFPLRPCGVLEFSLGPCQPCGI